MIGLVTVLDLTLLLVLLRPSLTFLVCLFLREVVHTPGEDDDLLSHIVDIVLGGDIVSAHCKSTCESISDDGIPCTTYMDRSGRVGGSVFDIDPDALLGPGTILTIGVQDVLDGTLDEHAVVHLEVEISVHWSYGYDGPSDLDPGCDLLCDHRRGLPKGLGHLEAGDCKVCSVCRGNLGLECDV